VVLNGTSSSGKTTLAIEVQRLAPELQLLHLQLDAFRAMEPAGYWSDEYRSQASLRLEGLCRAMNKAAAEFARCGQNVIIDHVLTPKVRAYMLEDLSDQYVLFVKVTCSVSEVERREAQRKDRSPGLAKSQFASVHAGGNYDLEVDTTSSSASEVGAIVAGWLRSRPAASAHSRMQQAHSAA